jgi:Aspartyl protease
LTKKCPKLDPTKRAFLQANDGCFKGQQFNQSQKSSTCPNGFPAAAGYKKVTTTHDAMGNAPKKTTPFLPNKGKSIAAVLPEDTPMSSKEDDVVAAVMPSTVLGNGFFSEGDVSPTLHEKHLILKFQIAAQHLDFPLKFNAMLDNGAHVVLIHPDTVSELQLKRSKLKKHKKVSIAISNKKKETMTLVDYVKFSVIMPELQSLFLLSSHLVYVCL